MAKKESQVVETLTEETTQEVNGNTLSGSPQSDRSTTEVVPKDKAYSILYHEPSMKWLAVEVTFDYETGTLGGVRVVEQNPQKFIIVERFQTLVGKNLL